MPWPLGPRRGPDSVPRSADGPLSRQLRSTRGDTRQPGLGGRAAGFRGWVIEGEGSTGPKRAACAAEPSPPGAGPPSTRGWRGRAAPPACPPLGPTGGPARAGRREAPFPRVGTTFSRRALGPGPGTLTNPESRPQPCLLLGRCFQIWGPQRQQVCEAGSPRAPRSQQPTLISNPLGERFCWAPCASGSLSFLSSLPSAPGPPSG